MNVKIICIVQHCADIDKTYWPFSICAWGEPTHKGLRAVWLAADHSVVKGEVTISWTWQTSENHTGQYPALPSLHAVSLQSLQVESLLFSEFEPEIFHFVRRHTSMVRHLQQGGSLCITNKSLLFNGVWAKTSSCRSSSAHQCLGRTFDCFGGRHLRSLIGRMTLALPSLTSLSRIDFATRLLRSVFVLADDG